VLLAAVLVVTIAAERNDRRRTAQAGLPPSTPAPAAAPSHAAPMPAPGQELDGAYQVDVNREQQTYNDNPDPQPPNVTTWWAFRSRCTATGCVAAGIMLDDKTHLAASAQGGDRPLVLDFGDGGWQSRPETVLFPCLGPTGAPAKQTTTQVLSLQPTGNGPLHGVMTVSVESNECGQKGAQIVIPATAGRTGAVPPDVILPEPPPR
jgi:serine/threonine-protein kinase